MTLPKNCPSVTQFGEILPICLESYLLDGKKKKTSLYKEFLAITAKKYLSNELMPSF